MSAARPTGKDAGRQSDLLLWIAAGAVGTVGVAWLLISQPWADRAERSIAFVPSAAAPALDASRAPEQPPLATALDNPLRMAQLAYDAGMLIEPVEYSAWTLYAKVLENEPDNAAALAGLARVADDLVRRGETALEQGRLSDARGATSRILAVLPGHEGAKSLSARLRPDVGAARAAAAEPFRPELPPVAQPIAAVAPVEAAVRASQPPARPTIDPIAEAYTEFEQAMTASRLLTPADRSAKHFAALLAAADPSHERTHEARERLSAEFLSRAASSIQVLDADAADTWIDEAELLGVNAAGVEAAREQLTHQIVALEVAKRLPASSLKVIHYVAPEYPQRALERRIEGWVDVEFAVAPDGTTRDVTVTDASHDSYFRREAVAAVEQWSFEPRMFMGRAIEQRSYTRIRFVE